VPGELKHFQVVLTDGNGSEMTQLFTETSVEEAIYKAGQDWGDSVWRLKSAKEVLGLRRLCDRTCGKGNPCALGPAHTQTCVCQDWRCSH
jgi:hypothetical protein